MSNEESGSYIHGMTPEEQSRLSLMNRLINEGSMRELAIEPGTKIIDVGCGLGQLARSMARAAGPAERLVGIDSAHEQLTEARRMAAESGEGDLVDFRAGSATDLPLEAEEWGTFDLAHARFVLEHVTDPLVVVRQMVRAVRPGGRIALADDDHSIFRLSPELPGFSELLHAYIRAYDRNGTDPNIGRRLVSILHQAGAKPSRNTWMFYGSCSGAPHFADFTENIIRVLEGARDRVVDAELFDERYFSDVIAGMREWASLPDAAMWYAICYAEGVKVR